MIDALQLYFSLPLFLFSKPQSYMCLIKIQLLKPYLSNAIATPSLTPLLPSVMMRNPNSLHNPNHHQQRIGEDKENAKPSISDSSFSFIPQSLSIFTWVLGILVVLMFIPIDEKSKWGVSVASLRYINVAMVTVLKNFTNVLTALIILAISGGITDLSYNVVGYA
ncbi:unnamed protein product [Lactuca virosa]|uniref:Uncharacterized protein n=1 Tax=Lactuca virosa TaxID=75947 RepID=A0AAU9PHR2_9ASTR|nr:unnamed protein product [Lactuca virosa]